MNVRGSTLFDALLALLVGSLALATATFGWTQLRRHISFARDSASQLRLADIVLTALPWQLGSTNCHWRGTLADDHVIVCNAVDSTPPCVAHCSRIHHDEVVQEVRLLGAFQ